MHVEFVYPSWNRPSECHPELAEVNAHPYIGTPSMSVAALAANMPPGWTCSFHDDRVERVEPGPGPDLVAMPIFTPAADRAMELADGYRAAGVPVVAGGIFTSLMPDVVGPHVDGLCIGEGEGVWPTMLDDFAAGRLKPVYRADRPWDLTQAPVPRYELYLDWVDAVRDSGLAINPAVDFPLQLSRGCPLGCSHCVVPHYMGPKLRLVPPEHIRACFEAFASMGGRRGATLTEDTTILPAKAVQDHLVQVAKACEDIETEIAYIGSGPEFIHRAPASFWESMDSLNVHMVYLMFGFGHTSRDATCIDAAPDAVDHAVETVRRIRDHGMEVYASFSIGHDTEDESVGDRVLEICRRGEVEVAEFAVATPYPGTKAWRRLTEEGRMLDRPWRDFNDANVVFRPAHMEPDTLQRVYLDLWRDFHADRPTSKWPVLICSPPPPAAAPDAGAPRAAGTRPEGGGSPGDVDGGEGRAGGAVQLVLADGAAGLHVAAGPGGGAGDGALDRGADRGGGQLLEVVVADEQAHHLRLALAAHAGVGARLEDLDADAGHVGGVLAVGDDRALDVPDDDVELDLDGAGDDAGQAGAAAQVLDVRDVDRDVVAGEVDAVALLQVQRGLPDRDGVGHRHQLADEGVGGLGLEAAGLRAHGVLGAGGLRHVEGVGAAGAEDGGGGEGEEGGGGAGHGGLRGEWVGAPIPFHLPCQNLGSSFFASSGPISCPRGRSSGLSEHPVRTSADSDQGVQSASASSSQRARPREARPRSSPARWTANQAVTTSSVRAAVRAGSR